MALTKDEAQRVATAILAALPGRLRYEAVRAIHVYHPASNGAELRVVLFFRPMDEEESRVPAHIFTPEECGARSGQ